MEVPTTRGCTRTEKVRFSWCLKLCFPGPFPFCWLPRGYIPSWTRWALFAQDSYRGLRRDDERLWEVVWIWPCHVACHVAWLWGAGSHSHLRENTLSEHFLVWGFCRPWWTVDGRWWWCSQRLGMELWPTIFSTLRNPTNSLLRGSMTSNFVIFGGWISMYQLLWCSQAQHGFELFWSISTKPIWYPRFLLGGRLLRGHQPRFLVLCDRGNFPQNR